MDQPLKHERLMTIKEVAYVLHLSYGTVRNMVLNGAIKSIKVLSSHRIRESEVEKYLKRNERTQK